MPRIAFDIPENKIGRITDAFQAHSEIPLDENGQPTHTPAEWAREQLREYVIGIVGWYEKLVAERAARQGVGRDNGLIT
jgi:hypothetical protein